MPPRRTSSGSAPRRHPPRRHASPGGAPEHPPDDRTRALPPREPPWRRATRRAGRRPRASVHAPAQRAARRSHRVPLPRQRQVEANRVELDRRDRRSGRAAPWRGVDAQTLLPFRRETRIPRERAAWFNPQGESRRVDIVWIGVVVAKDLRRHRIPHARHLRDISRVAIRAPAERRKTERRPHSPRKVQSALELLVTEAVRHAHAGPPRATQSHAPVEAETQPFHPVDVCEVGRCCGRRSTRASRVPARSAAPASPPVAAPIALRRRSPPAPSAPARP